MFISRCSFPYSIAVMLINYDNQELFCIRKMHDIVFVPIGYLTKTVAWKKWLHHVVKKLRNWELKEGAIVCKNGNVIAASQQFHINMNEFKACLKCDNNNNLDGNMWYPSGNI
ncbi:Hypothetical predicted protein [Octopus vulgaris]|uniref:Uncharacterized protein n=1 Tax=Octopus vulgaris TaxID=6645 RepID=A0AA36BBQ6_OCTVU|nr:Hypothetical predicted protein [Octopus vulgaris]